MPSTSRVGANRSKKTKMAQFQELKSDILHTLEDFLGMYEESSGEVVVVESIANSLDESSSQIDITLDAATRTYTIVDNGPGMSKEAFERYHTVAVRSKAKGKGIGFAGVGAKIYLAAWKGAQIVTESYGKDGPFASRMYQHRNKAGFEDTKPKISSKGTSYKVYLSEEDFLDLNENILNYILFWYNWAIYEGVKVTLDGKEVRPWLPDPIKENKGSFRVANKKYEFWLWLSEKDIPLERKDIEYVVFGKRIKAEHCDFMFDADEEYRSRLGAVLFADGLADFLTANKTDFQKNQIRNNVYSKIRDAFYSWMHEEGLISTEAEEEARVVENDITQALDKLLLTREFKWLNPWSSPTWKRTVMEDTNGDKRGSETAGSQRVGGTHGGDGPGGGVQTSGGELGKGVEEDKEGTKNVTQKQRMRRGINFNIEGYPDDPREGWISFENKAVVYNMDHPFHVKISKTGNKRLVRYDYTRVIISVLLSEAQKNEGEELTISEAFRTMSDILGKLFTGTGEDLNL